MPNQYSVPYDIEAAKAVLARHSRLASAADELGVTYSSLKCHFSRRGLCASSFLAKVPIPDGMEIRALHTQRNEDGKVTGQTILAQRESKEPPKYEPIPATHYVKGMSTFVGPEGNVRGQWIKTDHERIRREEEFWKACEAATDKYRGLARKTKAPARGDKNLHNIFPLGDPHVGMMSWAPETGHNFDTKIAVRELFATCDDLVTRAPAAESCTVANLGDFFHSQDDRQVTPGHGHKLDVDSRSSKIAEIGFNLYRRIIDRALEKFRIVKAIVVPGNHDPDWARMMALWLKAVYENEPRVDVVSNLNPFHFYAFGKNLFGFAHGNEIKLDQLPGVMAHDVPEMWGQATHRFWHTGHVHHDQAKEYPGVMVHTWRTLAPNDVWAHSRGYRSGKSLCAITYHREGGEYSRVTVDLGHVQRKIAARAG